MLILRPLHPWPCQSHRRSRRRCSRPHRSHRGRLLCLPRTLTDNLPPHYNNVKTKLANQTFAPQQHLSLNDFQDALAPALAGPPPKKAAVPPAEPPPTVAGIGHKAKSRPHAGAKQDAVECEFKSSLQSIKTLAKQALQTLAAKHGMQDELCQALVNYDDKVGPIGQSNMVALAFCAEHAKHLNHAAACLALQAPRHTRKHGKRMLAFKHTPTHPHTRTVQLVLNYKIFLLNSADKKRITLLHGSAQPLSAASRWEHPNAYTCRITNAHAHNLHGRQT